MKTSRRSFIGGLAVASMPVAAVAMAPTPLDRLNAAFEELKAAAAVVYPDMNRFDIHHNPEGPTHIVIAFFKLQSPSATVKTFVDDGSSLLADDRRSSINWR